MVQKQKQMLKLDKKKGKRGKPATPETADEYLAAGVDHEEAGGKWRASDAAKSSRFFVRAIEAYESGLQRFPESFDLAYNRARIQYELSQQPRLVEHLPGTLFDLLQTALQSHRYALQLKSDDADALFNTAQVLTSLGESLVDGTPLALDKQSAIDLFREALTLFQKCLGIQEHQYAEEQIVAAAEPANTAPGQSSSAQAAAAAAGNETTTPSSPTSTQEQWALVVDPITPSTLFDTCLAQFHTLAELLPLLPGGNASADDEAQALAASLLQKVQNYRSSILSDEETSTTFSLAEFNLLSTLTDFLFRTSSITADQYADFFRNKLSSDIALYNVSAALCDHADACITFNNSLSNSPNSLTDHILWLRWDHLRKAAASLQRAAGASDAVNKSAIHSRRGDVELLGARLAEPPFQYSKSIEHKSTLLMNAETYYRGAKRTAAIEGDENAGIEMSIKEAVVMALRGSAETLSSMLSGADSDRTKVEQVMVEMVEDGLIEAVNGLPYTSNQQS